MRKFLIPCLLLNLSACDFLPAQSVYLETCEEISKNRLKHSSSFEKESSRESNGGTGYVNAEIAFKAWNDYKVPIPYNISCLFKQTENKNAPLLVSITWNGRPIRSHELENIQEALRK